jgi:hypothetical protein
MSNGFGIISSGDNLLAAIAHQAGNRSLHPFARYPFHNDSAA